MRLFIPVLTLLLPFVLSAKEVPGEELPSNDAALLLKSDNQPTEEQIGVVKRSINEIAARRRSALDKSFMRFGRSDPTFSDSRVKLSGGNLMRFGRGKPQDFMRFGRSTGNVMRFGRAANLMRFGRGGNNMMRFGRGGNNMMRFGRSGNNMMRFGRGGNNMMRFGRGGNNMMRFGRGGNNMMRFGRSDNEFLNYESEPDFDIETEIENDNDLSPTLSSDSYIRIERSTNLDKKPKASNYADKQNDNFMRLGRSLVEKTYYEDKDEDINDSQEQYIYPILENENDRVPRFQNKMFLDDNFLKLNRDTTETPEEIQDPLEIIFPDEGRKKRSLIKADAEKKLSTVSGVEQTKVASVKKGHLGISVLREILRPLQDFGASLNGVPK